MTELPEKHVAAAIIKQGNTLLACRRATGDMQGFWEFPGGKVEPGESSEQAVRREIAEELSIKLTTIWFLDTVDYDYPDFHLKMDCFVCSPASTTGLALSAHDAMRWLTRDELLDVKWLPADHQLIEQIGTEWDFLFASEHL